MSSNHKSRLCQIQTAAFLCLQSLKQSHLSWSGKQLQHLKLSFPCSCQHGDGKHPKQLQCSFSSAADTHYALRRQLQCSKMGAPIATLILLLTTFVHSSHQWTSHGSVLFFSEGESTLLEAPGDASAGCKWIFTHSETGHSCCFASHSYFCDSAQCNNRCCERAGAEVNTEVDGVPGCTLALTDLSERKDKGSYKVVFPANSDQGLEVSLWVFQAPPPVSQPVYVDPEGTYKPFRKFYSSSHFFLRTPAKVLGLGRMPSICHQS